MSIIPKANPIETTSPIPKVSKPISKEGISFSFQTLDFNEYFNLDGTCINWPTELFNMLKDVSKISKIDLIQGKYKTYRVHSDETATSPVPLPAGIELKSMHQIRIGKSKGGIHGIFSDDIFYIVWLDPLHNLYPDKHHGGLRKIKPGSTCCKDRDEELIHLKQENEKLRQDNQAFEELFESI